MTRPEMLELGDGLSPLRLLRFGQAGPGPKVYLQAGLHADELPGMLVLRDLARHLAAAEAEGRITGEILVLPQANPLGQTQHRGGYLRGRFLEATGENFNRGYPDLAAAIRDRIGPALGPDATANVAVIRAAMGAALAAMVPQDMLARLRGRLMDLAHDADIVLDLHADNHAVMHLYTGHSLWPDAADLAADLGAQAVLLCDLSGGNPFDEACSAPWWDLARTFPGCPVPAACLAATVELRSNNDARPDLAARDAAALLRFLMRRGAVAGDPGPLPPLACAPVPLEGMAQLKAPCEGIVIYQRHPGDRVETGDLIAWIVDPTGGDTAILAPTCGHLFACHDQPFAWPGKVIGKIAGARPLRAPGGPLLTD